MPRVYVRKTQRQSWTVSGFKKTGIWPFNPDVFTDEDFAPAEVTDQPEPAVQPIVTDDVPANEPAEVPEPEVNQIDPNSEASPNSSFTISPTEILPLPKMAGPRATKRKRKSERVAEITSENYRQELATSEASKTIKAIKKGRKPAPKKRSKKQKLDETCEDVLCELCGATFADSDDGQGWKKCLSCLIWFHAECSNDDDFECRFCN